MSSSSSSKQVVDIQGLDKMQLLRALWKNQKPAIYFAMSGKRPPDFDEAEAKQALEGEQGGCIDYLCGRAIKCDLSGDLVDPSAYDKLIGFGMFAAIVRALKQHQQKELFTQTQK